MFLFPLLTLSHICTISLDEGLKNVYRSFPPPLLQQKHGQMCLAQKRGNIGFQIILFIQMLVHQEKPST